MIHFRCSRCFHKITVSDEQSGTAVDCPYCHKRGEVPIESDSTLENASISPVASQNNNDALLGIIDIDDEAEMEIVEEELFDPDVCLIPVKCSACKTNFYASENQIGKYRRCPDCDRANLVPELEPKYRVTVELSPNGGYVVRDPVVSGGAQFRINVDYRTIAHVQRDEDIPETPYEIPNEKPKTVTAVVAPPVLPEEDFVEKEPPTAPKELLRHFFSPFLNSSSKFRLISLVFLGFISGLFAIQTVIWVLQGLLDTVPDSPGHVYEVAENGVFFLNYMFSSSMIAIGFIFVSIYSVIICTNSYHEKDNSTRWGKFSTDFGINIFLWILAIVITTTIPGSLIGLIFMLFTPGEFGRLPLVMSMLISLFFFFPWVFLAMLENDLFYDFHRPKKVYSSFGTLYKTWILFYLVSGLIFALFGTPAILMGWVASGSEAASNFHFQILYAMAFTLIAVVAPLLYFRLLGRMGWIIKETIELPQRKTKKTTIVQS